MYIKHASRNTLNKPSFALKWNMPLLYYRCKKWLHINIYKELVNNMTQMPRRCKTMDRLVGIIWYGQFHNKSVKSANRNPCFVPASTPPPLSLCDHKPKIYANRNPCFVLAPTPPPLWMCDHKTEYMCYSEAVFCAGLYTTALFQCVIIKRKIRANLALGSVTFHAWCGWKLWKGNSPSRPPCWCFAYDAFCVELGCDRWWFARFFTRHDLVYISVSHQPIRRCVRRQ